VTLSLRRTCRHCGSLIVFACGPPKAAAWRFDLDKNEALEILRKVLEPFRDRSYGSLVEMIDSEPVVAEHTGRSGQWYQLEIQAIWNDGGGGPVRVFGSIDGGGIRACSPLTDCFIKAPSGESLYED